MRALAFAMILAGCDRRPTTAICTSHVEYLRPDGRFKCAGAPDTLYVGRVDRIYCTGGTKPIRKDARTVGCQR